ncbi:MAG: chalcone isomerase family protein [Myxococcota bacterium]
MKQLIPFLLALVLTALVAAPARARECGGVTMPNAVTVDGTRLTLNGMGIREATMFNVDVYVAGLYVESRSRNGSTIANSDTRRRLVLEFVREVDRSDITDAFSEGFGGGAGLAAKIRQLNGWMTAAREGTRFTFTYVPGTGLEVKVGNRVRGTIEGADFATAFFNIWLGSDPPNAGLKSGLLGASCD